MTLKERFTRNPQTYYALSIAATWAGIGSLMNGVTMTQTYGAIPSLIWVIGNVLACILFGAVACKIPKVREVFRSRPMEYICAVMCVFQALEKTGMNPALTDAYSRLRRSDSSQSSAVQILSMTSRGIRFRVLLHSAEIVGGRMPVSSASCF